MEEKILIIQTAFIGDVILATAVAKKIHDHIPNAHIDFMVRKGNETLIGTLPFVNRVWVWNKKDGKYLNLFKLLKCVRKEKYHRVINLQRFMSSGLFTVLCGAKLTYGFRKNPLSFLFSHKVSHSIGNGSHEIERNQLLISSFTDNLAVRPYLYLSDIDYQKVEQFKRTPYICIAPASVWFTKQFPVHKWKEFIEFSPSELQIFIVGAPSDSSIAREFVQTFPNRDIGDLCGQLSLLESAALMQGAVMNYVNDSAPLHLASGVNAHVRAVFCSTIPEFGFGPLSDDSNVVQIAHNLSCRPCGLHGKKACPIGTFECAEGIDTKLMADELYQMLAVK